MVGGRAGGAWKDLIKPGAVFRREDHGTAHLATDAMLARGLEDHGFGHRENLAGKIAGHPIGGKLAARLHDLARRFGGGASSDLLVLLTLCAGPTVIAPVWESTVTWSTSTPAARAAFTIRTTSRCLNTWRRLAMELIFAATHYAILWHITARYAGRKGEISVQYQWDIPVYPLPIPAEAACRCASSVFEHGIIMRTDRTELQHSRARPRNAPTSPSSPGP